MFSDLYNPDPTVSVVNPLASFSWCCGISKKTQKVPKNPPVLKSTFFLKASKDVTNSRPLFFINKQ